MSLGELEQPQACLSGGVQVGSTALGQDEHQRKVTHMDLEQLLFFLLIGGIAGWLAGIIMKGGGFGLIGNIITGVLGALLGGWLFDVFNISVGGEWAGPLVTATVGAVVLLFAIGLIRKK